MKIDAMRRKYQKEWVLIEYTEIDEDLNVIEGEVIAHSSSKEEIYEFQMKAIGKQLSIEYMGEVPKDLAVMF
jgi:hypothetical protein